VLCTVSSMRSVVYVTYEKLCESGCVLCMEHCVRVYAVYVIYGTLC
jgi:hypothetical protein